MSNIYVISDSHFGHANILNFKDLDGDPLRVFDDVNHMNEHMIERWNSVVCVQDKVYHLGDVVTKCGEPERILSRLQGHKRLVLGNHDQSKMKFYAPFFEEIYSTRLLDKMLLSHIPVHPYSFGKALVNVHGHVHANVSDDHFGKAYYNVSVEVLDDYTPISFEELKKRALKKLNS